MLINQVMDNPFMIGELVHIPSGVITYSHVGEGSIITHATIKEQTVGVIIKKSVFTDYYEVFVLGNLRLILKEDMFSLKKKGI